MEDSINDSDSKADHGHLIRVLVFGLICLMVAGGLFSAGIFVGTAMAHNGTPGVSAGLPALPLLDNAPSSTPEQGVNMDVFWEVWNTIDSRFYYPLPSKQDRVYGAINGLISSLGDPFTHFASPDVAKIMNEDSSGTFEGIGAYVEQAKTGGVQIIRVFDNSPAKTVGLQAGDIIVAADGTDVTQMDLNQALLLIRGPAGTSVTVTVERANVAQPFDLTIPRARLEIPTVESRMIDGHIGYVSLYEFNAVSGDTLKSAVQDLMNQGADKLVLDLRNNPGGYLDQAVNIADMFLPKDVILIQRDVDGNTRTYEAHTGDFAENIPLVVLINGNSASASEIVAGAIKDNHRGILIGTTSFGKGSVQLQYNLSDGSLLRVTYANWFTPDDTSITKVGITPDITVEAPAQPSDTSDPQLDRAVQYLETGQ